MTATVSSREVWLVCSLNKMMAQLIVPVSRATACTSLSFQSSHHSVGEAAPLKGALPQRICPRWLSERAYPGAAFFPEVKFSLTVQLWGISDQQTSCPGWDTCGLWRDSVVPLNATVWDLNFSGKHKQFLPAFTNVEVWVTYEKSSKGIIVLEMPLAYI